MKKIRFILIGFFLFCASAFAQRGGEEVVLQVLEWDQLVGIEYNKEKDLLKNTQGENWGASGAFSKQYLNDKVDGQLEFNIQDENIYFALGLSHQNVDNHYKSMDHAFYFDRGSFFIFDKGQVIGQFGNYKRGDHFKIKRTRGGSSIGYYYNSVEIFQSSAVNTGIIFADLSLFSEHAFVDVMQVDVAWEIAQDAEPVASCLNDDNHNWVSTKTYDLDLNLTSNSKVYSDRFGKNLQNLSENLETGTVFVAEPIYDALGRVVIQTLPAPKVGSGLCYVDDFVENESGEPYEYSSFDLPNTSTANFTGQINHPKRVKDTEEGSLGWYYSHNNTDEAYVPSTDYPYSRVEYSKANPGQVKRSSSAGDVLRMGKGHEMESYTMSASSELYYVYGYSMDWNSQASFGSQVQPINIDYQVIKSISVDPDEKEYVSFTDHDGKMLASCRAGLSETPLQTVESIIAEKGYIDIHLPQYCESSLYIHYPSGSENTNIKLRVLDLSTDKFVDNGGTELFSINQQPDLLPGFYRIEHVSGGELPQGISVTYQLNYERFTLNYYDQGGRLVKVIPPLGIDDAYIPGAHLNVWGGSTISCSSVVQNRISTNQPSNLSVITGQNNPPQQVAHISFWASKLLDPTNVTNVPDPVSILISNNQLSSSQRIANLAIDRVNIKRNNHFISGGINDKGLLAFSTKSKKIIMDYNNQFFHNELVTNLQDFEAVPLNTSASNPVVSVSSLTEQTYKNYDVHYQLGYRKTDGTFVVVKDNLIVRLRKHTKHTILGTSNVVGNTARFITYINGENSALITDFENLDKYEVVIEHVNVEEKAYVTSGPQSGQYIIGTSQVSDISTISDLQYFGLRLHVENISQSNAPNHTMAKTYQYNSLNWLLETNSIDEGRSKFVYRNDGQIRFSQNARQELLGYFSYTNYDKFARPIVSGEARPSLNEYIFTDHYGNAATGSGVSTDDIIEQVGGFANIGTSCPSCVNKSKIYYDVPRNDVPQIPGHIENTQTFVDGNISKTSYGRTATWYSYDHYGRITWIIKGYDINMANVTPTYKLWEYTFDAAGRVTQVVYQPYSDDYFAHIYDYDSAGRLEHAYTNTTSDINTKVEQAEYIYYAHGPLKRVELANNLQGIDYVYTINGALKSINNPNPGYDPGQDGINNNFSKDQFAMTLDYYAGDYSRSGSGISNVKADLWNPNSPYPIESNYSGGIASQHWNSRNTGTIPMDQYQNTYIYKYDAFNQLNEAVYGSFKPKPVGSIQDNILTLSENYKVENITYNKNGNIVTLQRRDGTGVLTDDLDYDYKDHHITGEVTNQLDHVADIDAENQSGGNYIYDASGRLIEDVIENLKYIYNVQGLVTRVENLDDGEPLVEFEYDDGGFRSKKIAYTSAETSIVTLYVRDISGQVTSIYQESGNGYRQIETPFYGNARIGTKYGEEEYVYELKDHLGNVRQTIKTTNGESPLNSSEDWAYSKAEYYPFGMKFMNVNSYRYGYQGEYAEDETGEDGIKANSFQLRLYNPRLGRWLNPDPYGQYHSPYLAMGNNPVSRVDPDGGSDICETCPEGKGFDDQINDQTMNYLFNEKTFMALPVGSISQPVSTGSSMNMSAINFQTQQTQQTQLLINIPRFTIGPKDNISTSPYTQTVADGVGVGLVAFAEDALEIPMTIGYTLTGQYEKAAVTGAGIFIVGGSSYVFKKMDLFANPNAIPHTFNTKRGHLNPTTDASRGRATELFEHTMINGTQIPSPNVMSRDFNDFWVKTYNNGQVWVETSKKTGKIKSAGVNKGDQIIQFSSEAINKIHTTILDGFVLPNGIAMKSGVNYDLKLPLIPMDNFILRI